MNTTVTLNMIDDLTNKEVSRTLDITTAMKTCDECMELGDTESQREELERWIKDRGNKQHDTFLTLTDWVIN